MRKQTFFNILLIITTVTAIGVFISIVYLFQQSANESAYLNEKEQMQTDVEQASERINEKLQLAEKQLNLLAEADEIRFGATEACDERINRLASFISDEFDYFARSDSNGVIDCASLDSIIGSSLTENNNSLGGVFAEKGEAAIFQVVNNRPENIPTSMNTIIPLYDENSQINGTLTAGLYLNEFGEEFAQVRSSADNGELLITDIGGTILYSAQSEESMLNYDESTLSVEKIVLLDAVFERAGSDSTDTIESNDFIASYSLGGSSADFQWIVVAIQSRIDMVNAAQVQSGFLSGPESVLGLGMIMIVVGVGVVLLIMLYSNRIFFRPIKGISRALKKASEGNLDTKIPLEQYSKNDEFYTLSHGFNQMIESIRESTEELETLVSARTEDLVNAKSELESAKSSLEDKVKELERLNNLMIGREMRMIELKDEIERLKKEATDEDSQ